LLAIPGRDGRADALEHGRLDEHLGAHAGVDAAAGDLRVQAVEHVGGAEADRRGAAVDVFPPVGREGDVELAGVFGGVGVGVADEGGFVLGCGSKGLVARLRKRLKVGREGGRERERESVCMYVRV